jgi:hypothetical protein
MMSQHTCMRARWWLSRPSELALACRGGPPAGFGLVMVGTRTLEATARRLGAGSQNERDAGAFVGNSRVLHARMGLW